LKIDSNIKDVRETSIECKFTKSIEELETELDKKLSRIVDKLGYKLDNQGLKDSVDMLEKQEIENRLNRLINEYESLKDEYNNAMTEREEVIQFLNFVANHMPSDEYSSGYGWYADELMSRTDQVAIQYINDDDYRHPTVVFSYTEEYTKDIDKFVSLMCMDSIEIDNGRYEEFYLRIYPYKNDVYKDEIFVFSDSLYSRSSMVSEAIYECLHNASVPGMTEREALEIYDWYRIINAEEIIEDVQEEELYHIDKKLEEYVSEIENIEFEIKKLNKKLGKNTDSLSNNDIFSNSDSNDFSEFESPIRQNRTYGHIDPFFVE
jgi:hypothetical protein